MEWLQDVLALALLVGASILGSQALVAFFPDLFGKWIISKVEHRHSAEIERLRADLQAQYDTVRNSVTAITALHGHMGPRTADAVEQVWTQVQKASAAFSPAVTAFTIFTPAELGSLSNGSDRRLMDLVGQYHDGNVISQAFESVDLTAVARCRLYTGDRLWLIASIALSFRARLAYELNAVMHDVQSQPKSGHLKRLLGQVLDNDTLDRSFAGDLWDIPGLLAAVDAAFLAEARRVLYGSQQFASSLNDYSASLLAAKAAVEGKRSETK